MKILFINLADPEILGKKSGEALQKKHKSFFEEPNKVTVVHLMNSAMQYGKSGAINVGTQTISTIQLWLKNQKKGDKIIIAAHGKAGDTEYCYAESDPVELFKTQKLLNYEQLAAFIKNILVISKDKRVSNITLSICYGARSKDHEKDHILDIKEIDVHSSFAAKFYAKLLPNCVRMKAVTGSVAFDPQTGSMVVESEEAIRVIKEYDHLLIEIKRFNEDKVIPLIKEFAKENGEDGWTNYIHDDVYKKDITPLDKALIELFNMQARLEKLRLIKILPSKKDYGQVIFNYDEKKDLVTISLKHQGKEKVLKKVKQSDFIEYSTAHKDSKEISTEDQEHTVMKDSMC